MDFYECYKLNTDTNWIELFIKAQYNVKKIGKIIFILYIIKIFNIIYLYWYNCINFR